MAKIIAELVDLDKGRKYLYQDGETLQPVQE